MPSQPRSPTRAPLSALFWSAHDITALQTTAEGWRDDPFPVRDALRNLVNNAAALEGIARRSSVHANGFAKIVLLKGKRSSIRLHVWHRSNGRWVPDTMPHGHRWEFASWILTGELRETTFREAAGGVRYERLAYRRLPNGRYALDPDGDAPLRPDRSYIRTAGTVYTRDRSVLHTATPHGHGLVAALVLQGPRRFDPTPVYRRPGVPHDHREWRVSADKVQELVSEVEAAIR